MSLKQRKFYVLLPEKNKLKMKFAVFGIVAGLLAGGYFTEYFLSTAHERQILIYNKRISEVGKVRSNLAFINYYTYQLMLKPQD